MKMYGSKRIEAGWDTKMPKKLEKIRRKTARKSSIDKKVIIINLLED